MSDPLEPLAAAIADKVWAHLQERIKSTEGSRLLSVVEAAERMGIRKTKLHGMISSGEFPSRAVKRVGRRLLIASAEMDRWISAQ